MTEIHAFDPDGTPSPGARTALDNATEGLATEAQVAQAVDDATTGLASEAYVDGAVDAIPEATTDTAGLMAADDKTFVDGLPDTLDKIAGGAGIASRTAITTALESGNGTAIVFAGSSTMHGGSASEGDRRPVDRIANYMGASMSRSETAPTVGDAPAVWEIAINGARSSNYLTDDKVAAIGALKPVLMVHMIGSNDYSYGVAPSTYEANMRGWLNKLAAASPDTVHLLIGQHQRNSASSATYAWSDYTDVLRAIAADQPDKIECLDLWPRYARVGIPGSDPWGWLNTDGVHLLDEGCRYLAEWIAEYLGILTPDSGVQVFQDRAPKGGEPPVGDVLTVTIPPRPYPRMGVATASIFAKSPLGGNAYLLLGSGGATPVRARIGEHKQHENIPLVTQVKIPANESHTIRVWQGGNESYVSSSSDYCVLTVHVSPV